MYKLLSGAKAVKQYRGDENLPEAKKGMKSCGCKHPKKRYKYQAGADELTLSPETESPLARRQRLLAGIATGETDLRRVTGLTPEVKEVAKKPVNKYVSYNEMSDEDKEAYRKGMASGKDFEVGGRKYAAVPRKRTQRSEVVVRQKAGEIKPSIAPIKKPSVSQIIPPTVKGDSWTEEQWKDFLRKRNAPVKKPVPVIPKAKIQNQTSKGVFLNPKSVGVLMSQQGKPLPPIQDLRKIIYNFPISKTKKVSQTPRESEIEEPTTIDTVKKFIKDSIKKNIPDGNIKETILNNPISSWPSLATSAIRRNWAMQNPEDERTATIKVPFIDSSNTKSYEEKSKVIKKPDLYITGDTLQDKGLNRRYHTPEIIDLDNPNITYDTRNRGEYNEIKTEGAPITSPYPFMSSKEYFTNSKDPSHIDYIGVDSKGKIKIGKKNDFQDDDYQISRTYVQNVESFDKLMPAIGNSNFQSPQVNIVTDSGVKMKTNLNFLVPKGDPTKAENTFDEVSGGRYIFETPDKKKRILVSGSLKTIKETFNKMKKNNPYLRVVSLDNGSYAKGIRTFDQTLTPEDLKTYDAQNPEGGGNIAYIKSRVKKYKYGTGALTIPEGSAIVTANGGKNMQALKAYKQGNYKLLNKIIDDMPEDNVDKKQGGANDLKARYIYLAGLTGPLSEEQKKELENIKTELTKPSYDLYDDERIAKKFGQKYDVDKPKHRSSLKGGKLKLIEDNENVKYRNRLRNEPAFFQEEMKAGRVTVDKDGNVAYKPQGTHSKNKMEFLGTSKTGELPTIPTYPSTTFSTTTTTTEDKGTDKGTEKGPEKENTKLNLRRGLNIPSLAEIAARTSILGRGIDYSNIPENYLKLDKYNYASQLPATLREIQLAEQAGRETSRDVLGGDAGRYLAQAGNLSAARMKASNQAVIADTLARQDILNKNVDLTNTEISTNRSLKDYYSSLRNEDRLKARAAYDEQLIGLGQRIDSATETAQQMANQRDIDNIKLNLLKSKDYYMDSEGNIRMAAKGAKKLKTYKRK